MPALGGDLDAVVAACTVVAPRRSSSPSSCPASSPASSAASPPRRPRSWSAPSTRRRCPSSWSRRRSADGLIWATVSGTYSDPIGLAFHAAYRAANGRPPGRSHAGIAYDSVHLLAQAWAQVGNPRRFGAVADALRRTVYRGVNGTYYLGTPGQSGLAYPT